MKIEEARVMVEEALEQRRKFGKHFTVRDMPPEFLDSLVMVFDDLEKLVTVAAATRTEVEKKQHDEIVLLKRQLGAAKSRETQLRQQLAGAVEMAEAVGKEVLQLRAAAGNSAG
jgi:hypothetical protein